MRVEVVSSAACVLLLAAIGIAGCSGAGGAEHGSATLAGTVSIDGAPVDEGRVNFMPAGKGQSPPTSADIIQGKYRAESVPLGKVVVTFSATKETGRMISEYSQPYPEKISIVPGKYAQGIAIDVEGDNEQKNFSLESGE